MKRPETILRHRVIAVLTFNDGVLFRTKLFEPDYRYTHNFVDAWSIDEIIALDITRQDKGSRENFETVIRDFAKNCFVPLTVGGKIRTLDDVKKMFDHGADKITINTGALEQPELISEIASKYGTQCVVLSIDAKINEHGNYEVFSNSGSQATGRHPAEWAVEGEKRGAGEILLTSIERDGSLQGYDIDLCISVTSSVRLPVLILGGCGTWANMLEGIRVANASAACTQNIYHFTETSIQSAKQFLNKKGIPVRL